MAIGGVINPVMETYNQFMQEESMEISINSDFTMKAKLYIQIIKETMFLLWHTKLVFSALAYIDPNNIVLLKPKLTFSSFYVDQIFSTDATKC